MLKRLETMVLMGMDLPLEAIRGQIAGGIDIIVHLARQRDHSRKVVEISEITGFVNGVIALNKLFDHKNGKLVMVNELINKEKLMKVYG